MRKYPFKHHIIKQKSQKVTSAFKPNTPSNIDVDFLSQFTGLNEERREIKHSKLLEEYQQIIKQASIRPNIILIINMCLSRAYFVTVDMFLTIKDEGYL